MGNLLEDIGATTSIKTIRDPAASCWPPNEANRTCGAAFNSM
jgi:hypothetical protein